MRGEPIAHLESARHRRGRRRAHGESAGRPTAGIPLFPIQERQHEVHHVPVEPLHGAEEHGYLWNENGEGDWLAWYRAFARSQVAEVGTMRDGLNWSGPPPTSPDLYVGLFDTLRYGTGPNASGSATTTLSALRAREVPTPLHADTTADTAP